MDPSPRTIFIGDVHGCADELGDMLRRVSASRDDRIVFVGDLVAKGPDSQAVVARARELKALSVRGNHDEVVLRYRRALCAGAPLPRLKKVHQQVIESLTEEDWQYLEQLPTLIELPELEALAVHAGIVPGRALTEQLDADLISMRTLRHDGTASARLHEGSLWASHHRGPSHVVFGHDAVTGLQQHAFATGLDTGCVYGRALTALVVPEMVSKVHDPVRSLGKLVSVDARRCYEESGT